MTDHTLTSGPADVGSALLQAADVGSALLQAADPGSIHQVVHYRDGRGRVLEARIPFGALLAKPSFSTTVTVMVRTPMGEQPMAIEVEIEAPGVREAFDVMDAQVQEKAPAAAQARIAQIQDQARRVQLAAASRIHLPG